MTGVGKRNSSGLSEPNDENLARDLRGRHYVPAFCEIDEAACERMVWSNSPNDQLQSDGLAFF